MVRNASWAFFWPRIFFLMVGHILRICGARIKNEAYTGLPRACNLLMVMTLRGDWKMYRALNLLDPRIFFCQGTSWNTEKYYYLILLKIIIFTFFFLHVQFIEVMNSVSMLFLINWLFNCQESIGTCLL